MIAVGYVEDAVRAFTEVGLEAIALGATVGLIAFVTVTGERRRHRKPRMPADQRRRDDWRHT